LYYHLVAIVVIVHALVRRSLVPAVSADATTRVAPFERPSDARA
jgi:hypothetical protein